jgi:hypothetical protein
MQHVESTIYSLLKNEGCGSCLNNTAMIFDQTSYLLFSKFEDKIKDDIINFWKKHTNQTLSLIFIIVSSMFFIHYAISSEKNLVERIYGYL